MQTESLRYALGCVTFKMQEKYPELSTKNSNTAPNRDMF